MEQRKHVGNDQRQRYAQLKTVLVLSFPWLVFGSVYATVEENLTVIRLTTKWPIASCRNNT